MSDWDFLRVERDGRVLTVHFDSGSEVNSLSNALMRELTSLAREIQDDSELSCVILTGRADTFTAGMDLRDPELAALKRLTVAEKRTLLKLGPAMCSAWEAIEAVTVVAIEGMCIGGGMALAVSCDWRVASQEATLYVPELKLGMNMSWQSVPRFVNLIGPAKTKQLLLLAERIPADTGLDWGLVDYLAEPGEALARAKVLGKQLAAMPPVPLRMAKRAINASANALNDATSFMDADQFLLAQGMEDAVEGARAFFEQREPEFRGD